MTAPHHPGTPLGQAERLCKAKNRVLERTITLSGT